jgi:hypothetical protein
MIVTITIRGLVLVAGGMQCARSKMEASGVWTTETEDLLDDSMEAKNHWKNLRIFSH